MNKFKIVTKEPFWWFITGKKWGDVAMTFGNVIYCRADKLTPDVLAHEMVHLKQHKYSKLYAFYILIRSSLNHKFHDKLELEATTEQFKVKNNI